MKNVEIITIGDELLIGQVVDTNSAWMAQQLNRVGLDVQYKTTVGDNEADMLDAFERACGRASVVLVTGGIGPTKDDITKKTLCRFFNTELIFDETTLQNVQNVIRNNQRALNVLTNGQAYVPKDCTVIQNRMGTAPITWFERNGVVLVSMPGVPFEMKWVMTEEIIPRLQAFLHVEDSIQFHTIWVKDFSESALAIHLDAFENELPEQLKLAYLPTSGLIRLRLTGKHSDKAVLTQWMEEQSHKLSAMLNGHVVSEEDEMVEVILHKLLLERNLTLSVAESCTGGTIASRITAIPGCSKYFMGSVVSYSNEAKQQILGVNTFDIEEYGAVSQTVVEQMSAGAQRIFHTDCSIATSGIAGPDGGTDEKPVGTVWIAVRYRDRLDVRLFHFSRNREHNILRSTNAALLMLLELVRE